MALTEQQISELDIASQRVGEAKTSGTDLSGFQTDIANIEYAKTQGYTPFTAETPDVADSAIAVDEITPEADIALPEITEPVDTGDATVAGAAETSKTLQDFITELTPTEKTETQEEADVLTGQITDLLKETGQRPIEQLEAEEELGLPGLRQDLAAINADILSKSAEYESLKTSVEGKAITMGDIIGQQAQIQKAKASEIGLLQARALGMQGQVEAAQATADRAIDLKYSVLENNLSIYEAQLNALSDDLNREETILFNAQQRMLDDQSAALEEQKSTEKEIQALALTAMQNGADGALVNQISSATDLISATEIAGDLATGSGWQYVSTPAERDQLISQGYEITQSGGRTYARPASGASPEVQAYVNQIQSGAIKLTNVPAAIRGEVAQALETAGVSGVSGGTGGVTGGGAGDIDGIELSDNEYATELFTLNPDASREELKLELINSTDMSVTEINALLDVNEQQRATTAGQTALTQEGVTGFYTKDEIYQALNDSGYAAFFKKRATEAQDFYKDLVDTGLTQAEIASIDGFEDVEGAEQLVLIMEALLRKKELQSENK